MMHALYTVSDWPGLINYLILYPPIMGSMRNYDNCNLFVNLDEQHQN